MGDGWPSAVFLGRSAAYFWFTAAAALGEIPALWLALLLLKIAVLASMMKNDAEEQS